MAQGLGVPQHSRVRHGSQLWSCSTPPMVATWGGPQQVEDFSCSIPFLSFCHLKLKKKKISKCDLKISVH